MTHPYRTAGPSAADAARPPIPRLARRAWWWVLRRLEEVDVRADCTLETFHLHVRRLLPPCNYDSEFTIECPLSVIEDMAHQATALPWLEPICVAVRGHRHAVVLEPHVAYVIRREILRAAAAWRRRARLILDAPR